MSVSLDQVVTGLGLLGNVLSLPNQVENQQIQNEQTKALLQGSGIPDDMIKAATPEPMMRWLSPQQGGFTGHVLGGVGDVGSILSTIVGKPVAAPRMQLSELAAASKLRADYAQRNAQQTLADAMAKGPQPKADGTLESDTEFQRRVAAQAMRMGGSSEASLRMFGRTGETQPWRGTPGERTTQTLDAQRTERAARRASMLAAGYDAKTVDFWVETGNMPPQGRQTPAEITADEEARQAARDRIEQQRRETFVTAHPELTPEQQTHYRGTGQLPTTAGPKVLDFKDLYMKTLTDAQQRVRQQQSGPFGDPTMKLDEAAVMEDALQQADAIEQQGGQVKGKPQRRTPDAGPQETGIGMSTEAPGAQPPAPAPAGARSSTPLGASAIPPPDQWTPDEARRAAPIIDDARNNRIPPHVAQARLKSIWPNYKPPAPVPAP